MKIMKKIFPFNKPGNEKPLHTGEIYYLWETLTVSHKIISVLETYQMNTEDSELHVVLKGLVKGTYLTRVNRLEIVLKEEGFTVPPRSSPKTLQGEPGAGQEVKLTDDEVIRNLISWAQIILYQDARAIGAFTRQPVRKIFISLLFEGMQAYRLLMDLAVGRHVFESPPLATARDDSLNMGEVFMLWEELGARHVSMVNLETYLANTKDRDLQGLLKSGLYEVTLPQMERLENMLKDEGFTIPPRPVQRMAQEPPGQVSKIVFSDGEIVGVLTTAAQAAINHHVSGYCAAVRDDVSKLFKDFTSAEIEDYEKLMQFASSRNALDNPPVVTSRRG
ncbi:MAG: hypothetical protein VR69_16210 [Peptococcaceae bacterium BRH_c4b]|nr:MAG: hypothetical protein VR69_16210 [Peptococcaceae bacterium BRH_c4b]